MPRTAALVLALLVAGRAAAQHPSDVVYVDTVVARVDVALEPDSLAWVFAHPNSDHEVPARFTFTRGALQETVDRIGFRLRGNTSRASRKKSFKVSFNTFVRGQDWRGVEKLNLNGEHNDPSLARTATTWNVFRAAGVVAPRVGYAELYVNGEPYGLYANVEHLDETYLERRFGRDDGDLFKCLYPADLADRGSSGADYRHSANGRPVYEFAQGADADAAFDRLAGFITTLNRAPTASLPAALEAVFDVNSALRAFAADVATGNWDDYWYNQNNFYLHFDPATERFVYLPYDADNTLGVDFVGQDWGRRAPYTWGAATGRPLATRLLTIPEYRARFTFYLRRLLAGPFTSARLDPHLDRLEATLAAAAARDPYRGLDYGYTLDDFHRSFREATGAHVKYGLKPFVQTRAATLAAALDATNVPPIVDVPLPARRTLRPTDALTVTVRIEDEAPLATATLAARLGTTTTETPLRDDGQGADVTAGDAVFTATVAPPGGSGTLRLTATARDVTGQERTSRAVGVTVSAPTAADVVVNEFMASNGGGVRDPAGDAEDWVELHNPTAGPVRLLGMTLTDNLAAPAKWALPDTTIPAGGFVVVWADEEPAEGPMHAAFKLSASGEALGLYRAGAPVDTLRFGAQASNVAWGRAPDATGPLAALVAPTPGAPNAAAVAVDPEVPAASGMRAFPNPAAGPVTLAFGPANESGAAVEVFDVLGRRVRRIGVAARATRAVWDGADDAGATVAPGVYVVRAPGGAALPVVRR